MKLNQVWNKGSFESWCYDWLDTLVIAPPQITIPDKIYEKVFLLDPTVVYVEAIPTLTHPLGSMVIFSHYQMQVIREAKRLTS